MSPSATLTPEQDTTAVMPAALWAEYRRKRTLFGEAQRVASRLSLDACGVHFQPNRERWADELVEREQTRGLTPSAGEVEAEIVEEAEAVEVEPAAPEEGSTAAIRADAEREIPELEAARSRLAVDALTDGEAKQELLDVEAKLLDARRAVEWAGLADADAALRQTEAAEQAVRAAREQGAKQARELQPAIATAAAAVDGAAAAFAESVVTFKQLREQQAAALVTAGRGQEAVRKRSFRTGEITAALYVALRDGGVKVEGVTGTNRDQPLAAGEPAEGV